VLVAAAICPHPPLLVPELAAGAAGEMDDVRRGCADAVAAVWSARPDVVFVVGVDAGLRAQSFAPWGAPVAVDVPEPLPLPHLLGAWLTRGRNRSFVVVEDELAPPECVVLGAELGEAATRVGLIVMGDGSARHSEKAPGYLDERAAGFDRSVDEAFARADVDALLALDPLLARELMVAGRAPWQVLAGAARDLPKPTVSAAFAAPYGVGYHVVAWEWQVNA
jgi:hypothetical protein